MNASDFSKHYPVRKLGTEDIGQVYALCKKNTLYYQYCPPFVTRESIEEDRRLRDINMYQDRMSSSSGPDFLQPAEGAYQRLYAIVILSAGNGKHAAKVPEDHSRICFSLYHSSTRRQYRPSAVSGISPLLIHVHSAR